MNLVASLINNKNVRVKTTSIVLIFLVALVPIWSPYVSSVLNLSINAAFSCSICKNTFHNVSVSVAGKEILLQIQPLILPTSRTECSSCGNSQYQTSLEPNGSQINIVNYMVQEQSESQIIALVAFEFNGTTFEATITTDLLWSNTEQLNGINRTTTFSLTKIITENISMQFYSLSHLVQHKEYMLTAYTGLIPLDSNSYNISYTLLKYIPTSRCGSLTLEFIKINTPVTLSQNYFILGKVANELGNLYKRNETLSYMAESYYKVENEVTNLAQLVSQQLKGYNKIILQNTAIITDPCQHDAECYWIAPGFVCLGQGCGPCFTCTQSSQCTQYWGAGSTCYGGCCRQPGYQPPPQTGCKVMNYQCQVNCLNNWGSISIICFGCGSNLICQILCWWFFWFGSSTYCYMSCCQEWY